MKTQSFKKKKFVCKAKQEIPASTRLIYRISRSRRIKEVTKKCMIIRQYNATLSENQFFLENS